jgi:hypothetical protein
LLRHSYLQDIMVIKHIAENFSDPGQFTSCRRYPITSYTQLITLHGTTCQSIVFDDRNWNYLNSEAHPNMDPMFDQITNVSFKLCPCLSPTGQAHLSPFLQSAWPGHTHLYTREYLADNHIPDTYYSPSWGILVGKSLHHPNISRVEHITP